MDKIGEDAAQHRLNSGRSYQEELGKVLGIGEDKSNEGLHRYTTENYNFYPTLYSQT